MKANHELQSMILDALESGDYDGNHYTVADIRENVEVALERHEQHGADLDDLLSAQDRET